jgi:6-phosphogluconolactonase
MLKTTAAVRILASVGTLTAISLSACSNGTSPGQETDQPADSSSTMTAHTSSGAASSTGSTTLSPTGGLTSTSSSAVSPTVAPTVASTASSDTQGPTGDPSSDTTTDVMETEATDSTSGATSEGMSSDSTTTDSEQGTASSQEESSTGDSTSSDSPHATYAFIVSVGGQVRALRLERGQQPEEVANYSLTTTSGDFFITATRDASKVFVASQRSVTALSFNSDSLEFAELDTAQTEGAGTYVEVSPDGEHVILAHYSEGKATHVGFDGAQFGNPSGYSPGMNAHSARVHPSGTWAFIPCLGSNHVAQFTLDGALTQNTPNVVAVQGGPRHMVFHPNGEVAYVMTELTGQVYAFELQDNGTLGPEPFDVEDVATNQADPWGSDVQITADGKHLYAFERRAQQLYHFDVNTDGTLTAAGSPTNFGQAVRVFAISPAGDLLVGGGEQGVLRIYTIDPSTGALTADGQGVMGLQSLQGTVIRDVPLSQ